MKDTWMAKKCTGILNPVHLKMASEQKLNTFIVLPFPEFTISYSKM